VNDRSVRAAVGKDRSDVSARLARLSSVSVFIAVKTKQHDAEWVQKVVGFLEVVDFYRLSGDVDYLIRAAVSDICAYDDLYQRLMANIDLYDVHRCSRWSRSSRPPSCRS
jgi:DNA-binding Lrp family transcriptional regulator